MREGKRRLAVEALTFRGPHLFYKIVVAIEIAVTLLIIVHALRWPRHTMAPTTSGP